MSSISSLLTHIEQYIQNRKLPKSVYFFTLHKCASTLFSEYVLDNIKGLKHEDYEYEIYSGQREEGKQLIFQDKEFIYGPIRLSTTDLKNPINQLLIQPTTQHKFIKNKKAIFFVRDPRDILVSSYYSYKYSHGLSPVKELKELQKAYIDRLKSQSLDEYVLHMAISQVTHFNMMSGLMRICKKNILLKYEDMISNFTEFITRFNQFIELEPEVIEQIYLRSRPKEEEDVLSHRRSGKVNGFRDKLKKETIDSLNIQLGQILKAFNYPL